MRPLGLELLDDGEQVADRICRVTQMVIRPSERFQALSWGPIAKKVS